MFSNRRVLLLAALCLLTAAICWPQDTRGSIVGKVTDPSGAVIPGATVVVTNTAMGTKANLTTNAEGYYQATYLIPGRYEVEAVAQGFKKALRANIEIRIAERLQIDMPLELGAAEMSVTVKEE